VGCGAAMEGWIRGGGVELGFWVGPRGGERGARFPCGGGVRSSRHFGGVKKTMEAGRGGRRCRSRVGWRLALGVMRTARSGWGL
jgi:hypothetical protein